VDRRVGREAFTSESESVCGGGQASGEYQNVGTRAFKTVTTSLQNDTFTIKGE